MLTGQLGDDTGLRFAAHLRGGGLVAHAADDPGVGAAKRRFAIHQVFGLQIEQFFSVIVIAAAAVIFTGSGDFR